MPVRRSVTMLMAFLLTGGVAAAAGPGGNYDGAARDIAPTAAQAKYTTSTAESAAARPSADKRRGYRSGWQVAYLRGTATRPVTALAVIYVYDATANAKRAYANACKDCSGTYRTEGVSTKFQAITKNNTRGVIAIATCRNIYVAVLVSGNATANALAQAAGTLAGGVYAKATAGGMSTCKSA